jgi:hypothetical protein
MLATGRFVGDDRRPRIAAKPIDGLLRLGSAREELPSRVT